MLQSGQMRGLELPKLDLGPWLCGAGWKQGQGVSYEVVAVTQVLPVTPQEFGLGFAVHAESQVHDKPRCCLVCRWALYRWC